jgi:membrane protein implicated in regulation of membrane protease activity
MIEVLFHPAYVSFFWLIVGIILLLLEIGTPGLFFFISLAAGAFFAALCAFLNFSLEVQCVTAATISLVTFWILRWYVTKKFNHSHKTNTDALIGKEAIIIIQITPHTIGRIKIQGEEWPAITKENISLSKGTVVRVIAIQGNKLIVR